MPDIDDRSTEGRFFEDTVQRFRRASENPPEWSEPFEGTWESIASTLDFPRHPGNGATPASPQGLSRRTVFAGIGGLLLGTAVGAGGLRLIEMSATPPAPVRSAVLTPLEEEDARLGIAELRPSDAGYSLVVEVPDGVAHPDGYVEVWLINVDLTRMVSVGVFAAGTSAQFPVSDELIESGYLIVDLSNEEFDEEPQHSGDTIMRGELRA